jgi:aarF domain-containing kinase
MRPLQDQCFPTDVEDGKWDVRRKLTLPSLLVEKLFQLEVGQSINELFTSFDPVPIGVASLAQVHLATDRQTGRKVAVKVMHPNLEDFSEIDIATSVYMLKVVKRLFPAFAFEWLGEEMQE